MWFKKTILKDHPVLVIGDSHTRIFARSNNFLPVFLGPGKSHNFLKADALKFITEKSIATIKNFQCKNVLFYLAEPDTRFFLQRGWYPWEQSQNTFDLNVEDEMVNSVNNYKIFLKEISEQFKKNIFFVSQINPSPRKEQNPIIQRYNECLNKALINVNIQMVKSYEILIDKVTGRAKSEYVEEVDPVHLNSNIIEIYIKLMGDRINFLEENHSEIMSAEKVRDDFEYNERFGCYTPKKN